MFKKYILNYQFFFSLHLGIQSGPCEEQIIRLDEAYVQNKYKVRIFIQSVLFKLTVVRN